MWHNIWMVDCPWTGKYTVYVYNNQPPRATQPSIPVR